MNKRYNSLKGGEDMKQHRQGDVFFQQLEKLPKDLKLQKSNVLVYGESTGHGHRLQEGSIFLNKDGLMYLALSKVSKVTHEEHKAIKLEKGLWAVVRQREYTPEEIRTVID